VSETRDAWRAKQLAGFISKAQGLITDAGERVKDA
jgi:hypothetical protein